MFLKVGEMDMWRQLLSSFIAYDTPQLLVRLSGV